MTSIPVNSWAYFSPDKFCLAYFRRLAAMPCTRAAKLTAPGAQSDCRNKFIFRAFASVDLSGADKRPRSKEVYLSSFLCVSTSRLNSRR
jgi:hypothetical protein